MASFCFSRYNFLPVVVTQGRRRKGEQVLSQKVIKKKDLVCSFNAGLDNEKETTPMRVKYLLGPSPASLTPGPSRSCTELRWSQVIRLKPQASETQ